MTYAGYSATSLLRDNPAYVEKYSLREKLAARLRELADYHQRAAKQLEQEIALARLFNKYEEVSFFATRLAPALENEDRRETMTLFSPTDGQLTPRGAGVVNVFEDSVKQLGLQPSAFVFRDPPAATTEDLTHQADPISLQVGTIMDRWGYSSYTFYNLGGKRRTRISHHRWFSLICSTWRACATHSPLWRTAFLRWLMARGPSRPAF